MLKDFCKRLEIFLKWKQREDKFLYSLVFLAFSLTTKERERLQGRGGASIRGTSLVDDTCEWWAVNACAFLMSILPSTSFILRRVVISSLMFDRIRLKFFNFNVSFRISFICGGANLSLISLEITLASKTGIILSFWISMLDVVDAKALVSMCTTQHFCSSLTEEL